MPDQETCLRSVVRGFARVSGGSKKSSNSLRCEPIMRNPDRLDYRTRFAFRVFEGNAPLCHLTVGIQLDNLWERCNAFYEACPSIACKPLFFEKANGWDYLALDYFLGRSLEELALEGRISAQKASDYGDAIVSLLKETRRRSSVECMLKELDGLFERLISLPVFTSIDQQFVKTALFPFIREGFLSREPETRWTNGDLVPRNILADDSGAFRLIDYEFAGRTHFYHEDWWRWRSFTRLPLEARDLRGLRSDRQTDVCLEAYFIVRQLVLSYENTLPHLAAGDARHWIQRLLAIASVLNGQFHASWFFNGLVLGREALMPESTRNSKVTAQLFWSADGSFCEKNSQMVEYAQDQEVVVRFSFHGTPPKAQLRFDPVDRVGLVCIDWLRITARQRAHPILFYSHTTGWDGLQITAGGLRLPDSPSFNFLSLNTDPALMLPPFELGLESEAFFCEVCLRFNSDISSLPNYLGTSEPDASLLDVSRMARLITEQAVKAKGLQDALAESQRAIADKEQIVAERDKVIAEQSVKMKGLHDGLIESKRNVTSMELALIGLRAEFDERGGANEALEKRLHLVEGRFAEVEQELLYARQLADERSQVISAEAEKVSRLEIALAAKEARVETFLAHISAVQSEVAARQTVELDLRASIDMLKKDAGELRASRDRLLVEVHDQLVYAQSVKERARLASAWTESQSGRTIEALQSQVEQLRAECGRRRLSIVWNMFMRCVRMLSWKRGAK